MSTRKAVKKTPSNAEIVAVCKGLIKVMDEMQATLRITSETLKSIKT